MHVERKYCMFETHEDFVQSLEFRFLIDRYLAARRVGQIQLAKVYAHAAEGLLAAAMPSHADAISGVASRKGDGRSIGSALAQTVSPSTAGAIFVVWSCRQARRPAIDALFDGFRNNPAFSGTVRMLCARAMLPVALMEVAKPASIEIAAAYRR
jgi:hypothetical protein